MLIEFFLFLLFIGICVIIYRLYATKEPQSKTVDVLMQTVQGVNERFDKVAKELGGISELGRGMKEFQKDFESFFNNPKLRGNLGEQVLSALLEQVLPKENYKLQYSLSQGKKVDAIIKTDKGVIPIDSKFPFENYRKYVRADDKKEKESFFKLYSRDVQTHIDAINEKYIRPGEGTVDFALMYIPSESIYYDTILDEAISKYATDKRVLIVSPNSFYYFLKVILMGLEGKRVEETAKRILDSIKGLQKQSQNFEGELSTLNKHVTNAKNSMDTVNSEYRQIGNQINNIRMLK